MLVISRSAPDAKFAVEDAPPDAKFKSDTTTSGPAMALETLDLDDVKPSADLPISDKDVVSAKFTTFDGLTIDISLLESRQDRVDRDFSKRHRCRRGRGEKARGKVSRWTYAIPAYKANLIKTKLADLLEPAKAPDP